MKLLLILLLNLSMFANSDIKLELKSKIQKHFKNALHGKNISHDPKDLSYQLEIKDKITIKMSKRTSHISMIESEPYHSMVVNFSNGDLNLREIFNQDEINKMVQEVEFKYLLYLQDKKETEIDMKIKQLNQEL